MISLSLYGNESGGHHHSSNHLIFVENKGQWESQIRYKVQIKNGAIFLENTKLTVHVSQNKSHRFQEGEFEKPCLAHAYQIVFLGANPQCQLIPQEKTNEYFNFFLGNDTSHWKGNCGGYEEVRYVDIYPNIDLVIHSKNFQPKYTFFLRPGARIGDIQMKFVGLDNIYLTERGDLVSSTALGNVIDESPISFLHSEGTTKSIQSQFILRDSIVRFQTAVEKIDVGQLLEIDPQIIFSTYSGSTADNFGASATYDYSGNLYGTGLVFGTGYPTTTGAYKTTFGGNSDIAITKFNQTGSARVYSTYIGGSSYDVPHSLVVDQNNRLILLATTSSSNYPITSGAYKSSFSGGPALTGIPSLNGLGISYPAGADIAVTKFNPTGTGLIGSTFFGGSGTDGVGISTTLVKNYGDGIRGEVETDSFGNVYVASLSNSTNLPALSNTYKSTNSGGFDGILVKFNTNLTNLLAFTYVGGSGDDALYDLCYDNAGNIVAAGGTGSSNIGATSGVVNSTYGGNTDGFIVSLNNIFSTLRFMSYFGTADYDQIYFVETDKSNNVYVFGQTTHSSTNYYLVSAGFSNPHKGQFVSILNPTLTTINKSTTFGAGNNNPDISPTAFLVDYCDKIFITGWGSNLGTFNTFALGTTGLPVTSNAFQSSTLGNGFYMMILEGDLSAQYYGSYFGGTTSLSEEHVDGGTSRFDKNGIVYHAVCAGCGGQNNFPIFPSASAVVSGTNNSSNCNLGVIKFDFGLPVNADFTYSPACAPANIKFTNLSHQVSTNTRWRWTFSNGATSTVQEPTIAFSNPGIYTARLVIIDSLSCNIADTMIKTILVLGTAADTLTDKVICPGSSVKIGFTNVVDTRLTFTWSPTATLDDPTILSPFASPTATTTYRLIMSKLGCTDTFYQTVIVEQPKALTISGDSLTCIGTPISYTCNKYTGGSYDWTPKNILTYSFQDTAKFTFATFPVQISVNYTSPNGCITNAKKTIQQGTPSLKLSADSIACKGDIVSIIKTSNFAGGTYSYSPSSQFVSKVGDTIKVKVDTSMMFTVRFSLSPTCNASDSLSFKLLKDKINWKIDSVICYNQSAVATATIHPSYTLNWQPIGALTTVQGTSPAQFNLSNTNRYVYIHATHNQRSYCQFHDSSWVKFVQNIVKLRADTTKCRGSTVTIYHNSSTGVSAKIWSPASQLLSQTDSTATFRVTNTRYFTLTINDNSCSYSDSLRIRVINDFVKLTGDTLVCPKDTAFLSATAMVGASYTWLPFPAIISGANSPNVAVRVNNPQWFYVHVQDTNQCYIIDSLFVNNIDTSQVLKADFISNTNCQNTTVSFTNKSRIVTNAVTYFWDFAGQGTSNVANPSFTFSSYGLQNVKLTLQNAQSCNVIDSIVKQIYILHNQKTVLPEVLACRDDSVSFGLSAIVDTTAVITWSPSVGLVNGNTFSPKAKLNVTTIYTAIVTKNGCSDTLIQKINIDSPNMVKLYGDTVACQNSELLFTASQYSIGNYTWMPLGNVSYQNRDSARMIVPSNNFKVKVIYTTNFGCNSQDSLIIRTIPTRLNLSMDSIGCKDELLTIRFNPSPKGGAITYSPLSNIISSTDSTAVFKVDTSRLFTVDYKINNVCKESKTVPFQILKDAAQWQTDSITCKSSTVTSTAVSNSRWSLTWLPLSNLTTAQGVSPAVFGNFTTDKKIYLQASLLNRPSCQYSDSVQVRLLDNWLKITGPPSNCKDSFVTLSASLIPNTTYVWTPVNALFNSNSNTAIFKTDVSRYYYVTANFKNQCSVRDSLYIQTGNLALKLYADSVICPNDTVTLRATLLSGASYLWSNGATTNQTLVTLAKSSTFYIDVIDSNKCKLRDSISVLTMDKNTLFFLTKDTLNCKFDTLNLELTYLPKVQYTWAPSQFIKSGNGTNKIKAFIPNSTTFFVNAFLTRGAGCSYIDSIHIVKDTQFVKISGMKPICKGDTLTFIANYNPSFVYSWMPTNWVINTGISAKYKIIDSFWVYCSAKSSIFTKCIYKDSIHADYNRDLDNLRVTATPQRIEYGSTSTLNADAPNIIDYLWSPRATLDNPFIPSPLAKPDTTTTYYVTVKNPLGCRSSDSVTVTVYYEDCAEPEIFLPTGFTPNKDGKNDALYIRGDNILKMHLEIYDRWGQLIFVSNNQKKGWDGTFKGVELEPTVYAYHLSVECIGGAKYFKKGNITLIK